MEKWLKLSTTTPGGNGSGNDINNYYAGPNMWGTALSQVLPGETLWLIGGTTNLTQTLFVYPNQSGTPSAPKYVKAVPGHVVEITGGPNNNWPPVDRMERATNGQYYALPRYEYLLYVQGSYIEFSDIDFLRSGAFNVRVGDGDPNTPCYNVKFDNCKFNDAYGLGIVGDYAPGTEIVNSEVLRNKCCSEFYFHPSIGLQYWWGNGIGFNKSDNIIIRNNLVGENWGEGIIVDRNVFGSSNTSSNAYIGYNTVWDNHSSQIYVHALWRGQTIVENNLVWLPYDRGWTWQGITLNSSEGDWDPIGQKFVATDLQNVWVRNNVVIYCGDGVSISNPDGDIDPNDPIHISNIWIEHNSFINNDIGLNLSTQPSLWYGNRFRNNIIYSTNSVLVSDYSNPILQFSDYNSYYKPGGTYLPGGFPIGNNSLVGANPLLANVGAQVTRSSSGANGLNYKPTSSSPLIGAADPSYSDIPFDFFDISRPGIDDIGAIEADGDPLDNHLIARNLTSTPTLDKTSINSSGFADLIQKKKGYVSYTAPQNYITVTFDQTPTPGSLLVAGHYSGNGVITKPNGWSTAFWLTQPIDDDEGGLFYKIAGENEPKAVTVTSAAPNEHSMVIAEFAPTFDIPVLEGVNYSAYAVGSGPINLSFQSGKDRSLVVGLATGRGTEPEKSYEPFASGSTFESGYSSVDEMHSYEGLDSGGKWVDLEYKIVSTSGTILATWTPVNFNGGRHAGIAVFTILSGENLDPKGLFSSPVLGRPGLTPVFNLEADGLIVSSKVSKSLIGQVHTLGADSLSSLPVLKKPKFKIPTPYDALDLLVGPELGLPAISQMHLLDSKSIRASPTLETSTFNQTHILFANGLNSDSSMSKPNLTLIHSLFAENLHIDPRVEKMGIRVLPIGNIEVDITVFELKIDISVLTINKHTGNQP